MFALVAAVVATAFGLVALVPQARRVRTDSHGVSVVAYELWAGSTMWWAAFNGGIHAWVGTVACLTQVGLIAYILYHLQIAFWKVVRLMAVAAVAGLALVFTVPVVALFAAGGCGMISAWPQLRLALRGGAAELSGISRLTWWQTLVAVAAWGLYDVFLGQWAAVAVNTLCIIPLVVLITRLAAVDLRSRRAIAGRLGSGGPGPDLA